MRNEAKKRSRAWIGWVAVSLLIAYPLSLGPASLLFSHHPDERIVDPFNAVYAPLFWCCDKSDLFAEALAWYIHLWVAPT